MVKPFDKLVIVIFELLQAIFIIKEFVNGAFLIVE